MYFFSQKAQILSFFLFIPFSFCSYLTQQEFQRDTFNVLHFVDPLIGTTNGGHVFAGASLPFGMAKAVADTNNAGENEGGFSTDNSEIIGFSHMHDDGTGGSQSLGNFPLFPQTGCRGDVLDNCFFTKSGRASKRINGTAEAHPGYFAISLNTSIHTEMTVTNHTALYRFTFPATNASNHSLPLSPLLLVDMSDLRNSRQNGSVQVDPTTGRLSGNGTFLPSFGIGSYGLHFCADFSGASVRETGVFKNNRAGTTPKSLVSLGDGNILGGNSNPPVPAGAFTQFNAPENAENQILARVGVSFISVAQACSNAETEIPTFDFEGTLKAAEDAWRKKLSVISIDASGVDDELQTVFWSGTYRSMLSPQDYTGENPLWKSDEPYYDSFYCIWDSFRSIHPFLTIVDPESQTRMIRSLIDIYRFEGKLPDCRMSLCKGFTQGGSNADIVLADSYLKNISIGVDWETGYEAVLSDAEDEPDNWSVVGRGGLASWKILNYIPTDDFDPYGVGPMTRSISRNVEYAYNDFCISEMARGMGKTGDEEKYLERSGYWKNMYLDTQTSFIKGVDTGFTGFLQPRYLNGTFGFQDPIFCSNLSNFTSCYLNINAQETYEGPIWLYTFFVPQDMASLIATLGGPESFINRLTFLHTSGILYIGDEQAFLPVFQFHYAGRPALSSVTAHSYIPSQFNSSRNGLPGNDDSGAMGSFSSLAMMGLWPISGQDVYLITPPFFKEVNITNGQTGKTATVRNINFDPSYEAIFIQNATLDGMVYEKNWLTHSFFLNGGVLELVLGRNESGWGTGVEALPPSSSTVR